MNPHLKKIQSFETTLPQMALATILQIMSLVRRFKSLVKKCNTTYIEILAHNQIIFIPMLMDIAKNSEGMHHPDTPTFWIRVLHDGILKLLRRPIGTAPHIVPLFGFSCQWFSLILPIGKLLIFQRKRPLTSPP